MRLLRIAAALAAAVLAHAAGAWLWPSFPRAVDLFLVVAVLVGLRGSSVAGMLTGMTCGLVHDALSGGLYGLHGFADTILGYGTARVSQRLVIQRASGLLLVFFAASLVKLAIVWGLRFVLPVPAVTPEPLQLLGALINGAVGLALVTLGKRRHAWAESRRRSRLSKLRFD